MRYWEAQEEEERKVHEDCPTCGEKGHDKRSCPHELCLACGALDDHSTRECRQGVNCFRCGGRGHKSVECKKPRTRGGQGWARECMLCGSVSHQDATCPTLFRIYYYNDEQAYEQARKAKWLEYGQKTERRPVPLDYRSDEEGSADEARPSKKRRGDSPPHDWDPARVWCYNCAGQDHWGDDCPVPRCNPTRMTGDPSVYSHVLASSGPLARRLAQSRRDAGLSDEQRRARKKEERQASRLSKQEKRQRRLDEEAKARKQSRERINSRKGHT